MMTFSYTMGQAEFSELMQWIEFENPPLADIDAEIEKRAVMVPVLPLAELAITAD